VGYFPNGTAGIDYETRYCDHCVHQRENDGGCAVWQIHMLHNYDQKGVVEEILSALIPPDGIYNGECRMFHAATAREAAEASENQPRLFPW
jgi:hypothetical protein